MQHAGASQTSVAVPSVYKPLFAGGLFVGGRTVLAGMLPFTFSIAGAVYCMLALHGRLCWKRVGGPEVVTLQDYPADGESTAGPIKEGPVPVAMQTSNVALLRQH
mmetsp:Transcript_124100/g.247217  ORF Transcript_124100/g.247217 Transcript_124100/m.247217 type:complete len:105 (+) Transcript_124100:1460-1774(+)